ncbi:MAG TPA: hypothetical protein VE733_13040 [Streptosporangiaceae bacterium]|jgi:hypothetical protein|nr:hypothetical protein [Streptosporangiaceae bacterium]
MSDIAAPAPRGGAFDALDNSKISRFQLKIMFVSGMGFFTDAYDLFVIGIVVALLKPGWHLSTGQIIGAVSLRCMAGALCPVVVVKTPGEGARLSSEEGIRPGQPTDSDSIGTS